MAEISLVKLPSDEDHKTLLTISQRWFGLWLVAAWLHQAIVLSNVDLDLCSYNSSSRRNESKGSLLLSVIYIIIEKKRST